MEYKNYMEEVVKDVLGDLLAREKSVCKCDRCRLDMTALALNNLSPKYVVTDVGRAHTKLESAKAQFQIDIVKELIAAIQKVSKNPRH